MKRGVVLLLAALAAAVFAASAHAGETRTTVVVTLESPPLANALARSRALSAAGRRAARDVASPTSAAYLRALAAEQATATRAIQRTVPGARVYRRYQVVLNGLAVTLPRSQLQRLARTPGVARVWPSTTYRTMLDRSPGLIRAEALWGGPTLSTAGNGIKIGIIDDGVDQTHPFFNPAGYTMPPGYPKGNAQFTTAKVIAARAFAPASTTWRYARLPFDPEESAHGTHVAGIAAGNRGDYGVPGVTGPMSGVAPRAYIGNYKVLSVPTEQFGLNGNSPEIAAGIDAAVRDGMDVINLSLGEPEIEPSRDLVVLAIAGAANYGVVTTVAAGNDFAEYGRGSISSPGSAAHAITVAAATKTRVIAGFSSSGPTPISLQMKPDVTAPGVNITSSIPRAQGLWASFGGTSMAAPHVAGAVALLKLRHPTWGVPEIKAALIGTSSPLSGTVVLRQGGGMVDLPEANDPLVLATPPGLSFGFVRPGTSVVRPVDVADAGGGTGTWSVAVATQTGPATLVTAPSTVAVPGRIDVTATAPAGSPESEVNGYVLLTRAGRTRRIPFWLRVASPKLAQEPRTALSRTGTYGGTTRGKRSLVTTYRYPESPAGVANTLSGPEAVYRVTLAQPVANFGVAVLTQTAGANVSPRVVFAGDENRQTGIPALPLSINPYLPTFQTPRPISGAIRPAPGAYDIVFDTPAGARPGSFTFRFWIDDVTPPAARLVAKSVPRGKRLEVSVTDTGSGVDPQAIRVTVDGVERTASYSRARARISIPTVGLARGTHRLVLQVSDHQEAKNMENVPQILPNTRVLRARFTVR